MKLTLFWRKMIVVLLSIVALSLGWLGCTGLTLLVALTPLLWISSVAEDSRRGWWEVFGWALLCFVGWNLSTIWWIGFATPVGPIAATIASSFYSMLAFMLFHTISKRAPKALAYTVLVSVWIALEYNYTVSDFSWPWLLLGNGFSNDIWAIQWYEYTGLFGGTLWVLVTNILLFEAYRAGRGWWRGGVAAVAPLALSLLIYVSYDPLMGDDGEVAESVEVSVIQPNIDCYDKFHASSKSQEEVLSKLLEEVPATSDLILMPETAIPNVHNAGAVHHVNFVKGLFRYLAESHPDAKLASGLSTISLYPEEAPSATARKTTSLPIYHDFFNSAMVINSEEVERLRHKTRLVIGVENTPSWIFKIFRFFVVDLGGVAGQLGKGDGASLFEGNGDYQFGTAICYEGLYGDFYGDFVRQGASMMTIISNDGWWRDTPGHRHLYSMSSLRAVEHRRAIARSANTGTSGFIDSRGDSQLSMGWDERGVLTHDVALHHNLTIYTRWGDYIARIALLVAALSLLYFVAYRVRRRQHLV